MWVGFPVPDSWGFFVLVSSQCPGRVWLAAVWNGRPDCRNRAPNPNPIPRANGQEAGAGMQMQFRRRCDAIWRLAVAILTGEAAQAVGVLVQGELRRLPLQVRQIEALQGFARRPSRLILCRDAGHKWVSGGGA